MIIAKWSPFLPSPLPPLPSPLPPLTPSSPPPSSPHPFLPSPPPSSPHPLIPPLPLCYKGSMLVRAIEFSLHVIMKLLHTVAYNCYIVPANLPAPDVTPVRSDALSLLIYEPLEPNGQIIMYTIIL